MVDKIPLKDKPAAVDEHSAAIDATKYQGGERGIKEPPKSPSALADQWNAVTNGPGGPERYQRINQDMLSAFQNTYDKTPGNEATKVQAVKQLEGKINETTIDGKQVLVQVADGKMTVRNVEAAKSGEAHPDIKGIFIHDIGPKASRDLRADASDSRLDKPGPGGKDAVNTKQFPSDALFYKAVNANPEWAKAPWQATNAGQEALLKGLKDPKVAELAKTIPADMLDAKAGSTKDVNDFLEKKGFGRLLREGDPKEEAVAATLTVKRDWHADKSTVTSGDKSYPAIDRDSKVFDVNGKPVVELYRDPGKDGITVYAIPNGKDTTGMQAMEEAKKLIPQVDKLTPAQEGHTRIPMVDLSATESLGWLTGMKGGERTISQAMMQTTLKMDESGFDAKQALAMAATRAIHIPQEPVYTFNSEFTFVIAKNGQPIFAQPVSKESWKDPKRQ